MRILFVALPSDWDASGVSSFVAEDLAILRRLGHDVDVLIWRRRPIRELLRRAMKADAIFAWFVGPHSFAATFARKPTIVCVGGYDFANLPELRYGNMVRMRTAIPASIVLRKADALLYVDRSLMAEAIAAFGHAGRAWAIPTGYDSEVWAPASSFLRHDGAIAVALAPSAERAIIKGAVTFVQAAWSMPDVSFRIAGILPQTFVDPPPNLQELGWLDRDAMIRAYSQSAVVASLSFHEGLPNSVCEGMLCGCVPVGTDVGGTAAAIGDAGIVIPDPRTKSPRDRLVAAADAIRAALKIAASGGGSAARVRIAELFPIGKRQRAIAAVLEEVVGK